MRVRFSKIVHPAVVAGLLAWTFAASTSGAEPNAAAPGDERQFLIRVLLMERPAAELSSEASKPRLLTNEESARYLEPDESSNVRTLSAPHLVTVAGRLAQLRVGGERTFTVGHANGKPQVKVVPIGIRLDVVAVPVDERRLRLDLTCESAEVVDVTSAPARAADGREYLLESPVVASRKIFTATDLELGKTLHVGGLVQRNVEGKLLETVLLLTAERVEAAR